MEMPYGSISCRQKILGRISACPIALLLARFKKIGCLNVREFRHPRSAALIPEVTLLSPSKKANLRVRPNLDA
jgi:hypothetical protein